MEGRTSLLLMLVVAVYSSGIAAQGTVCENATLADIVFLVDGSSSIGITNFQEIRNFLRSLITGLDIGPDNIRIGLAQYSNEPYQEFLLKDHMDKSSLLAAVETFPYRTGGTETGKAIDFLLAQYFTKEAGSRASQRVPQIAVVITDGDSTDDVLGPAQRLRQNGVIVFGIGVGESNLRELRFIANWPPDRFLFSIDSYQALQRLTESLLQKVCVSVEAETQALADTYADIFFLVDSRLDQGEFSVVKSEMVKLINQLNVGAAAYRIGLAQYRRGTNVEFLLNKFQTKQETLAAVRRFRLRPQLNQPSNLGAALEYAVTHFFTSEAGGRADQGSEQLLVIVSGKEPDDSVNRATRKITSAGITLVAMSAGAPLQVMNMTASEGYRFDRGQISSIKRLLIAEKPKNVTEDCKGANVADIVFIVDESGSIKSANFQLVRKFLHSIVSGLDVRPTRVQIGIVTFSSSPRAQAYLNTFNNKAELLQFIMNLPYSKGGTKTGVALKFTRKEIFTAQKGSRKGVKQVAVVITDAKSEDDVREPAIALRRAGVTIYAVGIKDANQTQLHQIASHPSHKHVFNVSSFTHLKTLKQTLQKTICNDIIRGPDDKDCTRKDEADIYFLLDDSGSIEPPEFIDMQTFIKETLRSFRIGPQLVRVGLVKYAERETLEFDLTTYSDAKRLKNAVDSVKHVGGGTKTGIAIKSMGPLFKKAVASRGHKVPEYLVVITDGESKDDVKIPAEELRRQGVIIYAVGVKDANMTQLHEISGNPDKTFFVSSFDALKSINNVLVADICLPDECKDAQGDVFFLTDSSGSIDPEDYQKMKAFMKSIMSKSPIGQDKMHFGVMQFSTDYQLEFRLGQSYSKEEMFEAIDKMQQMTGGTLTGKAITEVSNYFDAASGGRPDIMQSLIVITDGEAQDQVKGPAAALRAKGVMVYAIGVNNAKTSQLMEISGSLNRVFNERDFNALKDLESKVSSETCKTKRDCETIEAADIIFLVDLSTSIDELKGLDSMKIFMKEIVNQTSVGEDLTRFGIILFATNVKSYFTLKESKSKQKVLKAIGDLKIETGGNTHTGAALRYSLQYFNADHGGRKAFKVPQILMVITDGNATQPEELKPSSDALRDQGISVFSIGIKEAHRSQLEIMSGNDTSKVFYVDNFNALESLHKNISNVLCKPTKTVCDQADLVFLLDQSNTVGTDNFKTMKNFTAEVVKGFDVGEEFVRVGLALFNETFQREFYLKSFSNKADVINHILNMKYKGGNTHIGNALNQIRDFFGESQGGRSRIPRSLVVITDGDSQDDVVKPAARVRDLGINVFAIRVGSYDDKTLEQITGNMKRVYNVQNFEALADIKENIVNNVCEPGTDPSDCSIDIAVGFDVSQRAPGELLVRGHQELLTFLPEIVQYVSRVQGLCCAGSKPIKANIAFRVVGRDGSVLYDVDFRGYSEDVLRDVMTLQMSRPTAFNAALLKSFKEKFMAKSRADVKVLLIFSDGLDDDVMTLERESELLRQSGVHSLLTVALEGASNPAQLQMVEFGRGFNYELPLSISMPSVGSNILKLVDAAADRECCNVTCKCSGHEGIRGLRGKPGGKGELGQRGQQGYLGEEGVAGGRGPLGPSGSPGLQGCPGARGQKGYRGVSGERGETGEDGLDGVDGEQGATGQDGARGERGPPGSPGIPGIRAEAGLKGQRGLRGDPGESGVDNTVPGAKGDAGNPGLPGAPGPDGQPGEDGLRGNPGPDGRRGSIGVKGAPGGPGAPGLRGSPGASGPQGRRGENGDRGPDGISGFPGRQGEPGAAGKPGLAGSRGANGQKGQPGDPGAKGSPGSQGVSGMPGQDGRDRYGPPGPKGAKGDAGFPGYPGQAGEDGVQGPNGYPGRRGNQGRGGNSGRPGESGVSGGPGHPGHKGPGGPPGGRSMTECQLITYIRDNCACAHGQSECPAYPTELVFGLDMSEDVTPAAFERQRSVLLSLLEDITISESNCPNGARVAVVGYSAYTKYLIRFQDYRCKKQLIESVKNIALERTSDRRQLGAAMRFVGQNVFKRVRAGMLMRKVAVFLSNGGQQDSSDIVNAIMEYRAANIVPAVISLRRAPAVSRAFEVDDTGTSMFTVLGRDAAADLSRVQNCAICHDPCLRSDQCSFIQEPVPPQEVDVDLVMVLDSSREMQTDEYAGVQQLLGSVVEQLAVSPQPRRAGNTARVAAVQQSGARASQPEFGLQTYQTREQMRRHLTQTMRQQGGSSALGRTLEFGLKEVLLKAGQPRRRRALLTVVGTPTAYEDRAKLHYVSQKAKCEGVALFVVTVGGRYNRTEVEELASPPVQQHLIHLGRLTADEQGYAQRFIRVFLSALDKGINTYPPPYIKRTCDQLTDPDQTVLSRQESAEETEDLWAADEGRVRSPERPGQWAETDAVTRGKEQSSPSDACFLVEDAGACEDFVLMWFFDSDRRRCSRFWYGGCGGNGNRFETQNECEKLCVRKRKSRSG